MSYANRIVVVVPARNEAQLIGACLSSLAVQHSDLAVLLSDNASEDGTAEVARSVAGIDLTVRTVGPLGPSEHFVSAIRWALASSDAALFAILAGDDQWSPGFVQAALAALAAHPEADVVSPSFSWEDGVTSRPLKPVSFLRGSAAGRRRSALLLPDHRELSNLVYGVYRRAAFETLGEAWAAGGDEFAADYAAAWSVAGAHRVVPAPAAHGRRSVRGGADLLVRAGHHRSSARGPLQTMALYIRLNVDINRQIASALQRAPGPGSAPRPWQVQVLRAPQWWWGALRQLRAAVSRS